MTYPGNPTKKAYGRLWSTKRLANHCATLDDLIDIYIKQVRSVMEFGVPVWNSSIKNEEVKDLERVQNSFLQIALCSEYSNYEDALALETLEQD